MEQDTSKEVRRFFYDEVRQPKGINSLTLKSLRIKLGVSEKEIAKRLKYSTGLNMNCRSIFFIESNPKPISKKLIGYYLFCLDLLKEKDIIRD